MLLAVAMKACPTQCSKLNPLQSGGAAAQGSGWRGGRRPCGHQRHRGCVCRGGRCGASPGMVVDKLGLLAVECCLSCTGLRQTTPASSMVTWVHEHTWQADGCGGSRPSVAACRAHLAACLASAVFFLPVVVLSSRQLTRLPLCISTGDGVHRSNAGGGSSSRAGHVSAHNGVLGLPCPAASGDCASNVPRSAPSRCLANLSPVATSSALLQGPRPRATILSSSRCGRQLASSARRRAAVN